MRFTEWQPRDAAWQFGNRKKNLIGTSVVDFAVELHRILVDFGEALMRDWITRIIHGNLDPDPPCLGASVREGIIDQACCRQRRSSVAVYNWTYFNWLGALEPDRKARRRFVS